MTDSVLMSTPDSPEEERSHFIALLKKFRSAMLVTLGEGESFHSRPMAIARVEEDGRLWFITAAQSTKVHEIEADSQVAVTVQDGDAAFVALSGRASLVDDRQKVAELWREPFRAWFPGGKDDPSIELILVRPERGEYWDNKGINRITYLWETIKAYATGTRPEVHEGEHHGAVLLK
jgi:general stress protein 26